MQPHPPFTTPPDPEIPRFEPDLNQRNFGWRPPFLSPDNGRIVELVPGIFHANPITEDMLDGTRVTIQDFRTTAIDLELHPTVGTRGFTYVYDNLLREATYTLKQHGMDSPYHAYWGWGFQNPTRRAQVLLSAEAVWDTYGDIQAFGEPNEKRYKFLRVIEAMFDEDGSF